MSECAGIDQVNWGCPMDGIKRLRRGAELGCVLRVACESRLLRPRWRCCGSNNTQDSDYDWEERITSMAGFKRPRGKSDSTSWLRGIQFNQDSGIITAKFQAVKEGKGEELTAQENDIKS